MYENCGPIMILNNLADKLSKISLKRLKSGRKLVFWIGFCVVLLSLISGFATYFILTYLTPIVPTPFVTTIVLLVNFIFIIALIILIGWHIYTLSKQAAAANLHLRIVALFVVIASLPAIFLVVFASTSLDRRLDEIFSNKTNSLVENSIVAAESYLKGEGGIIRADITGMAQDIDRAAGLAKSDPKRFRNFIKAQAVLRTLPMAFLMDENAKILSIAAKKHEANFFPPSKRALQIVKNKKIVVIPPTTSNYVSALRKLENFRDTYLYVMRPVNPKVIQHLKKSVGFVSNYKALEARRGGFQFGILLAQLSTTLTLLLVAIWIGLWFANRIVNPISRLIKAAESVSQGNLDVHVRVKQKEGDLAKLSSTFNNMTTRLRTQRNDLIDVNTKLDERRRFTEAVLSGVTSGVIGVDSDGIVTLINPSALELLGVSEEEFLKSSLSQVAPAFKPLFEKAQQEQKKHRIEKQIDIITDGIERHFAVRYTREKASDGDYGYVVTFDDITELVSAQRNTAWADIARRIAHEIKNPLTPIQLSAERIRRKYGDSLGKDRTVFDQCTDTIVRQVGDIGRMVDEFSSFARMPEPKKKNLDVRAVIRDAFILFESSHPDIKFSLESPNEPIFSLCDERLMSQAVTNLVKNASEAISSAKEKTSENPDESYKGKIIIRITSSDIKYNISVIDNGCGLPETNRNKLVEPYMTTREKGTGLGLAIVQKIAEQHGGIIQLSDAPKRSGFSQGACVKLIIPIVNSDSQVAEDIENISSITTNNINKKTNLNGQYVDKEQQGGVDGI